MRKLLSAAVVLLTAALTTAQTTQPTKIGPPDEAGAKAALNTSPRHGEWVDITVGPGAPPLKTWIVYPEVSGKAPVVIVIQEIFGCSDWLRATTDQLAAEGFIAIAPDLLSGKGPGGGTDSYPDRDAVVKAVRDLKPDDVTKMLEATVGYGRTLPASNGKMATVGFCWGGGVSFAYAASHPDLDAAVVCYGTPPKDVSKMKAPVLGLYGGDDSRVTSTVPAAEATMKAAGKSYEHHEFPGAGHGFFRQQDGKDGANRRAVDEGWPRLVAFLKEHTK